VPCRAGHVFAAPSRADLSPIIPDKRGKRGEFPPPPPPPPRTRSIAPRSLWKSICAERNAFAPPARWTIRAFRREFASASPPPDPRGHDDLLAAREIIEGQASATRSDAPDRETKRNDEKRVPPRTAEGRGGEGVEKLGDLGREEDPYRNTSRSFSRVARYRSRENKLSAGRLLPP